MVISVSYINGTNMITNDYSYSPNGPLTVEDNIITLSYEENNIILINTINISIISVDTTLNNNTWETINLVAQAGLASSFWPVGSSKSITLTNGENVELIILGYNHDNLSNNLGKANITFGMTELLTSTQKMNATNTNVGSFINSDLYTWLSTTLFNMLPIDLQPYIKSVAKRTSAGNLSSSILTNDMKLFLFAEIEVTNRKNSYSGEGARYAYYNPHSSTKLVKRLGGSGTGASWWLRSPSNFDTQRYCSIDGLGDEELTNAWSACGVCFGFCI